MARGHQNILMCFGDRKACYALFQNIAWFPKHVKIFTKVKESPQDGKVRTGWKGEKAGAKNFGTYVQRKSPLLGRERKSGTLVRKTTSRI